MLAKAGLPTDAEDCAIVSLNDQFNLVTNIDVFTPIHDDPYIMGKIAACNVTNDLFAMNATEVHTYSSFMALPTDMPEESAIAMIRGQVDFLKDIDAKVDGGHTIINPWPLIGGTASSVVQKTHMKRKIGVQPGDQLIITKPMGIQPIMAAYRFLNTEPEYLEGINLHQLQLAIDMAIKMMTTSNRNVAKVIVEENFLSAVHGMTDVTGFGFKVHLQEMLVNSQLIPHITHLPVIPLTPDLANMYGYHLEDGLAAETAGAMLIAIDKSYVDEFQNALHKKKVWHRLVGDLRKSSQLDEIQKVYRLEEVEY
jgi:selenide,water dikinase